jgi:hypothetical protein
METLPPLSLYFFIYCMYICVCILRTLLAGNKDIRKESEVLHILPEVAAPPIISTTPKSTN